MLYEVTKRFLDIVLSLTIGIVFSPIGLAVALAIKLTSPGPVFADTPKRVGKNGKSFKLYKFRSMVAGAHTLLTTDPRYRKLYTRYKSASYKLKAEEDPRVTSFGRFIRKHSLDELPQLINVLKGEMSLVGPRPYYPDELVSQQKKYPGTGKYVRKALTVRPGITGQWQVSGRSEVNFDKRIAMDADYAREKNLLLDLKIIIKTPWTMLAGRGAA